ncbi:MAG: trigger factor [Croceibacterium sp.]
MQIKETANQGLKRAYSVTIPAKDIEARIAAEVQKVAPQVRMPGFRPGKVPANLIRKMHGESLHSDAFNASLRESIDELMREMRLRPALQPKVDLAEGYEAGKDAELTVELEVLPDIEAPQVDGMKLEKLTVAVTDDAVADALGRIAEGQKTYHDAPKSRKAVNGDQLVIDFLGRVGGVEFDGGKAEGANLLLGSGQFIPGFEEQLVGVKAGDAKTLKVSFPADYAADNLKGRDAEFDVTVHSVKIEGETVVNEEFAKSLGLESLDKLNELIRGQLEQETAGLTRTQMKRQLLDRLAASHHFDVPQTMVEAEFEQIWQQLENEIANEDDPAAARAEIEAEKDDYRRIAERRVRLGLLLSEIGQSNGVEVSNQEMGMLVQQAAQQYRAEDRERFIEYVRADAMAQAQIRAPLYEDKVVDFLFDKADVTERQVTRAELEAAIEAGEDLDAQAEAEKSAKKRPVRAKGKAPATAGKPAAKVDAPAEKPPVKSAKLAAKTPAKKAATATKKAAEGKPAPAKKTVVKTK